MRKFIYRSSNGYTGVLRPGHGYSIYNSKGQEVLHTSAPAATTYAELIVDVERFPHFLDIMFNDK